MLSLNLHGIFTLEKTASLSGSSDSHPSPRGEEGEDYDVMDSGDGDPTSSDTDSSHFRSEVVHVAGPSAVGTTTTGAPTSDPIEIVLADHEEEDDDRRVPSLQPTGRALDPTHLTERRHTLSNNESSTSSPRNQNHNHNYNYNSSPQPRTSSYSVMASSPFSASPRRKEDDKEEAARVSERLYKEAQAREQRRESAVKQHQQQQRHREKESCPFQPTLADPSISIAPTSDASPSISFPFPHSFSSPGVWIQERQDSKEVQREKEKKGEGASTDAVVAAYHRNKSKSLSSVTGKTDRKKSIPFSSSTGNVKNHSKKETERPPQEESVNSSFSTHHNRTSSKADRNAPPPPQNGTSRISIFDRLYEDALAQKHKQKRTIRKHEKERELELQQECTFSPDLTSPRKKKERTASRKSQPSPSPLRQPESRGSQDHLSNASHNNNNNNNGNIINNNNSLTRPRQDSIVSVASSKLFLYDMKPPVEVKYDSFHHFLEAQAKRQAAVEEKKKKLLEERQKEETTPVTFPVTPIQRRINKKLEGGSRSPRASVAENKKEDEGEPQVDRRHSGYKGPITGWEDRFEEYMRKKKRNKRPSRKGKVSDQEKKTNGNDRETEATASPREHHQKETEEDKRYIADIAFNRLYADFIMKEEERKKREEESLKRERLNHFTPRLGGTESLVRHTTSPTHRKSNAAAAAAAEEAAVVGVVSRDSPRKGNSSKGVDSASQPVTPRTHTSPSIGNNNTTTTTAMADNNNTGGGGGGSVSPSDLFLNLKPVFALSQQQLAADSISLSPSEEDEEAMSTDASLDLKESARTVFDKLYLDKEELGPRARQRKSLSIQEQELQQLSFSPVINRNTNSLLARRHRRSSPVVDEEEGRESAAALTSSLRGTSPRVGYQSQKEKLILQKKQQEALWREQQAQKQKRINQQFNVEQFLSREGNFLKKKETIQKNHTVRQYVEEMEQCTFRPVLTPRSKVICALKQEEDQHQHQHAPLHPPRRTEAGHVVSAMTRTSSWTDVAHQVEKRMGGVKQRKRDAHALRPSVSLSPRRVRFDESTLETHSSSSITTTTNHKHNNNNNKNVNSTVPDNNLNRLERELEEMMSGWKSLM